MKKKSKGKNWRRKGKKSHEGTKLKPFIKTIQFNSIQFNSIQFNECLWPLSKMKIMKLEYSKSSLYLLRMVSFQ